MAQPWLLAFLLLFGFCSTAAGGIPVPPVARVVDQTGTLTAENRAALERMLEQFEARKGSQIAVVIVKTTAGEPIEQFALRVGEQWKLGRKRVDDGAILVVAKDDRALRIEVGYGLEGALNDATAKRIVSDVIVPRFRENDFFGGISAGLDRMIRVIDGEPLPQPAREAPAVSGGLFQSLPVLLIAALVIGGVLRAMLRPSARCRGYWRRGRLSRLDARRCARRRCRSRRARVRFHAGQRLRHRAPLRRFSRRLPRWLRWRRIGRRH
jgi:uncharacterized protein